MNTEPLGPLSYANWKAHVAGTPSRVAYEYPMFTDSHIVGDGIEGYGPYQFINCCKHPNVHHPRPTLMLRAEYHLTDSQIQNQLDKSHHDNYHGGHFEDELAALLSLLLGVRLKAGGASRTFEGGNDHRGRPVDYAFDEDPIVPVTHRAPILPQVLGPHFLTFVEPLRKLPSTCPTTAVAFVRAARLYQDAVWIAESQPELSWIMLVTSVEAVMNVWQPKNDSFMRKFRSWQSSDKFESLLASVGTKISVDDFVERVAARVVDSVGSTQKFIDFITTFLPDPPVKRAEGVFRYHWDTERIQQDMRQIYRYRSAALHAGVPFPAPMCSPAFKTGETYDEVLPPDGVIGVGGNAWTTQELPMYLHTFEYIVRGSVLNWWDSLNPNVEFRYDRAAK